MTTPAPLLVATPVHTDRNDESGVWDSRYMADPGRPRAAGLLGYSTMTAAGGDRGAGTGTQRAGEIVMNIDDLAQLIDFWPSQGFRAGIDHDREVTVDVIGVEDVQRSVQAGGVEKAGRSGSPRIRH